MKDFNQISNGFIFLKATSTTAKNNFLMDCGLSIGASLFSYGYQEIHYDNLPLVNSYKISRDKIFVIAKIQNHHFTNTSDRILITLPHKVDLSGTHEEKVHLIIFKANANINTPFLNHVFEFCNGKDWNITNDMESASLICLSRIITYDDLDRSHLLPLL